MTHILVVDDDARLRDLLKKYFIRHGYHVTVAADAASAQRFLQSLEFDLLILDVMMPGENGIDLARKIRQNNAVPILMLTARSELEAKLQGFEAGVDDYLAKPFEPQELLMRIEAILRRGRVQTQKADEMVVFGQFRFDPKSGRLMQGDERIELTRNEADILRVLAQNLGEAVSRFVLAEIMGGDNDAGARAVDVQMTRLRKKIEVDPKKPVHLETIRGVGYRLAPS